MKQKTIIPLLIVVFLAAVLIITLPVARNGRLGAALLGAFRNNSVMSAPPCAFATVLARDGTGNVWLGSEEHGVFRKATTRGAQPEWTQFTTNDGLGDNYAYSLAVDKQGRVWVGHLNHGVSVFNGSVWKNYDLPAGPIGERVFKIAVSPDDGDVWIGTSAGLTRYSAGKDSWSHYTRTDGLPADQVNAIAFDAKGNIYIGTQADGIAMATRESDYRTWRLAPSANPELVAFTGSGLPSKFINDLLVTTDSTVYAATSGGLAWSKDEGQTWQFLRGLDYEDKISEPEADVLADASETNEPAFVLPEDYVTCLAADDQGVVWLGFREQGLMAFDGHSHSELLTIPLEGLGSAEYPRAILPWPNSPPWVASYGGGLLWADNGNPRAYRSNNRTAKALPQTFPSPAPPPSLVELNALLKEAEAVPAAPFTNGSVIALEDDWRTEGEWQGRYGRFWIVLCANWSPKNDLWGAGWDVMYDARIGSNHRPGDSMRYWIQWLATKDNRCLEMSPTYLHSRVLRKDTTWEVNRRESEWCDNGHTYPMGQDGPHLFCSLSIPAGLFYLSLYEVNPNGHEEDPRLRDYSISVRPHPGRTSLDVVTSNSVTMRSFFDIEEFDQKPELARARVTDFWGGVYKRFLVRGPTKLTVQVNRNHSFNTILPGVMLDLVDELPPPYYLTRTEWEARQQVKANIGAQPSPDFIPADSAAEAAQRLTLALSRLPERNARWWAENKRRFYLPLLRWQSANSSSSARSSSYYQLNLFADWEAQFHQQGLISAREIEKALRWDEVTPSMAGMGHQLVSDYVKANPEKFKAR